MKLIFILLRSRFVADLESIRDIDPNRSLTARRANADLVSAVRVMIENLGPHSRPGQSAEFSFKRSVRHISSVSDSSERSRSVVCGLTNGKRECERPGQAYLLAPSPTEEVREYPAN